MNKLRGSSSGSGPAADNSTMKLSSMHPLTRMGIVLGIIGFVAMLAIGPTVTRGESLTNFTAAWTRLILMGCGGLAVLGVILQAQKRSP